MSLFHELWKDLRCLQTVFKYKLGNDASIGHKSHLVYVDLHLIDMIKKLLIVPLRR